MSPNRPMARVGVIDYGAGNIQSLMNALEHIGADVRLVRAGDELEPLSHVVLPGVGAFGYCASKLRASGLMAPLEAWVFDRRLPLLGICVGMQLFADSSDELGHQHGLGWIGGTVTRLEAAPPAVRVPHVGWNNVRFDEDFGECAKGSVADYYFDHSFAYGPPRTGRAAATCTHGATFSAVIRRDNIVGVQFHPEKSQAAGLRILRSFLSMAA